jgi:nucleoside-diphosphate-sugar epimerase
MNYGRSKMEMDKLAMDFHRHGELELVIVRSPWFYGPHQPPRQKLFFEMVRDGKAPIVGNGEKMRSMSYTGNLAEGLLLAASSPLAAGQLYWMADERPYTMNEIVDTIERLMEPEFDQGCVHRRPWLPGWVSEAALVADAALQSAVHYHQKVDVLSEMNKTIARGIRKAKEELGYAPATSIEEGMRKSLTEIFKKSQKHG